MQTLESTKKAPENTITVAEGLHGAQLARLYRASV
jgi:hypothetical protein